MQRQVIGSRADDAVEGKVGLINIEAIAVGILEGIAEGAGAGTDVVAIGRGADGPVQSGGLIAWKEPQGDLRVGEGGGIGDDEQSRSR